MASALLADTMVTCPLTPWLRARCWCCFRAVPVILAVAALPAACTRCAASSCVRTRHLPTGAAVGRCLSPTPKGPCHRKARVAVAASNDKRSSNRVIAQLRPGSCYHAGPRIEAARQPKWGAGILRAECGHGVTLLRKAPPLSKSPTFSENILSCNAQLNISVISVFCSAPMDAGRITYRGGVCVGRGL